MASTAHRRYAEIMRDVEALLEDHIAHQKSAIPDRSKLKLLVPSIGTFFTPLALHDAFVLQDSRRCISSRRFVAPSFNDIRLILNTAQILSLVRGGQIELVTFDGDVTLYDDGESLNDDNPVLPRLFKLMNAGVKVAIVTAAGYTDSSRYHQRLKGLLESMQAHLPDVFWKNLIVMGGESNYLFQFNPKSRFLLTAVPREYWMLDEMRQWGQDDITELLDIAENALNESTRTMHLDADLLRKERAVGIIPRPGKKLAREQLEETVLVTQKILDMSPVGRRLPFCAFNGGNDVFVDIGDKSWGVAACQRFFGGIQGNRTLHVGDQFLSAGANDFKTRLACTTAWIANPSETVQLLDEIAELEVSERSAG